MSHVDLEKQLTELPDLVAQCLLDWRTSTLERERIEAKLYLGIKAKYPDEKAADIKARLNESDERYRAVLLEITQESIYNAKLETLMAAKKLASLRTAY
jgi:hypothetical protein